MKKGTDIMPLNLFDYPLVKNISNSLFLPNLTFSACFMNEQEYLLYNKNLLLVVIIAGLYVLQVRVAFHTP